MKFCFGKKSHFVGTTFGPIRLLVDVTFRRVCHSVEKNSQVRHSVEEQMFSLFDTFLMLSHAFSFQSRISYAALMIKLCLNLFIAFGLSPVCCLFENLEVGNINLNN